MASCSLNVSWTARSGSDSPFVHAWSVGSTGYLTPQAFAFLLAVQVQAQGLAAQEIKDILRWCEPNQAEFLRASLDGPAADVESLRVMFQLDRLSHEERTSLEDVQQPLPEFVPWENRGEAYQDPARYPNAQWPVFRLQQSRADLYGLVGFLAALPLAAAEMIRTERFLAGGFLLLLGASVGLFLGRKRRRDVCSDQACSTTLAAEDERCPGCGGQIMGRIRGHNETMDAIDKLIAEGRWRDDLPDVLEEDE